MFPIDFQGRSTKTSKVFFFTRFQYFCDALYYDFWFAKNIVILIEIWANFYRKWTTISHKTQNSVEKNPWKASRVKFWGVFVKRAKKRKFSEIFAWRTHFSIGAGAMTKSQNYTNYTSVYRSMSILWGNINQRLLKFTQKQQITIEGS